METIASRIFDVKMQNYRADIFSNLKHYIKYDPELISFRNISIDHYNKMLDGKTALHIEKARGEINKLIDKKICEIEKTPPVDLIVATTLKRVEPSIQNSKFIATCSLVASIINVAGLVYLARR
jgi:hypothetical protein